MIRLFTDLTSTAPTTTTAAAAAANENLSTCNTQQLPADHRVRCLADYSVYRLLGRIAFAALVIPPIPTHYSVVWSVFRLFVTFMLSA